MFLNVVKHNIFETGCSYQYSCFNLCWNRLRSVNGNIGKISKFRCHSSLLRAVTLNIGPSGNLSTVKSGFNPCLKYSRGNAVRSLINDGAPKKTYSRDEAHVVLNDREKVNYILRDCEEIMKSGIRSKERMASLTEFMTHLKNSRIEIQQLVKILFYATVLNIRDEEILMGLSEKMISLLSEINVRAPNVKSYLISCRIATIRDIDAIEESLTWLCSRDVNLDVMVATISTLAFLDYFPPKGEVILQRIGKRGVEEFSSEQEYFNFVWSLVLLNRAEEEIIQKVLKYEFWKKLECSILKGKQGSLLKIMNIYAFAKVRKFRISPDMMWVGNNTTWIAKSKSIKALVPDSREIVNVITHFFPLNTYSFFVFSDCGLVIDAVCYLDKNCRPITEAKCAMEEGAIKLAILSTSFDNYCFPGKKTPTGVLKFYKAYLEQYGYKTLFLRFNFFPVSSSLEEKYKSLNKCIRSVLPDFDIYNPSNNCNTPEKANVIKEWVS